MEHFAASPSSYVEDIGDQPIASDTSLSDDRLAAGGLVKVQAFMRTKSSANAVRSKKAREKANSEGSGQVNVVAPIAAHRTIKSIAKELQSGRSTRQALESLLTVEVRAAEPNTVVRVIPQRQAAELDLLAARVVRLRGWRRLVARLLGLL